MDKQYGEGGNIMHTHKVHSKLNIKHLHRSEDKANRRQNLNHLMEKVIIRHLKTMKVAS